MQLDHKARTELRHAVLDDMARHLAEYEISSERSTVGVPWSEERVRAELDRMRAMLVEPYASEYECDDSLVAEPDRLPRGRRAGYVVAEDGVYRLLFDTAAEDYVLVEHSSDGEWHSWGIRGDASSTFLAR